MILPAQRYATPRPLHCIEFAKQARCLQIDEAQLEFGFRLYHCAAEAYFSDYMEFAPQHYESFRKAVGDGVGIRPVVLNAM